MNKLTCNFSGMQMPLSTRNNKLDSLYRVLLSRKAKISGDADTLLCGEEMQDNQKRIFNVHETYAKQVERENYKIFPHE